MDQDTLNYIFQGEWAELSPRWNFQLLWSGFGLEQALDARIFHYVDNFKPWHDLVFTWGDAHVADFARRFEEAGFPQFIAGARRPDHRKRHAKWRIRQALRWLPPVARRFARENARRRQYRDLRCRPVAERQAVLGCRACHGAAGVRSSEAEPRARHRPRRACPSRLHRNPLIADVPRAEAAIVRGRPTGCCAARDCR